MTWRKVVQIALLTIMSCWLIIQFGVICSKANAQGLGRKPTPYNLTLTSASTEYELEVGSGNSPLTQIQIKCRTRDDIYFGWSEGDTSDRYITIKSGSVYFENDLKYIGSI